MKKVILTAASLFVLTTAFAQEPVPTTKQHGNGMAHPKKGEEMKKQTVEQRAQKTVDKLNEVVGLTEDQKTKIYEFALTRAKSTDSVREKYKGQKDKKELAQDEIKVIRSNFRKDAKSILSAEQLEKLKKEAKARQAVERSGPEAHDALDTKD